MIDDVSTGARGPRVRATHELHVLLRREEGGPVLAVERVRSRDHEDCLAEAWLEACLRRGSPEVAFEDAELELRPVWSESDGRGYCTGFTLDRGRGPGDADDPRPTPPPPFFSRTVLEPVALRAARGLVAAGVLAADALIHYELRAEVSADPSPSPRSPSAVRVTRDARRRLPLTLVSAPLAPLLARSELRQIPGGGGEASGAGGARRHFPVFYTPRARERAERVARKGGSQSPPVETGGLLVGPLCLCPETSEIFAVVEDVLEATHAEATKYSLTFSGETWDRIQAVMRARQEDPATRSHRILGQTHGHSFLPLDGAPPCEHCFREEWCPRNTAFLSDDDLRFCRAVFRGEPWQLSHVFGLNARGEEVEAFFGQRGGELVPRDYRILDSFDETDKQGRAT